ncbi:lysophospholipid acyltransferase family protein [Janibacter sp. G1551]|uniref:lysophospholipid acyltransferase family protein n=1 Tax=Janibacter sp. G1551 TaxID=3420440 RepID=UPI003D0535B2
MTAGHSLNDDGRQALKRDRVPWAYRFAAGILRPLLMVLTKRDWRGQEHIPATGGFVVCANHISHFDPLTFAHFMFDSGRPAYFLGKVSVFQVPFVGFILRKAGQVPVYRETPQAADAMRAAVAAVNAGKPVAVYPEGTLTREPDIWPMRGKTGAARIALETRCPVLPVAQWGAQEVIPVHGHARPHLFPRKTMHMRVGPPIDLSDLYGAPLTRELLLLATERIMDGIENELEQIRGAKAPAERYDPVVHGQPSIGSFDAEDRRDRPA